ncbi:DUF1707 domain-containing protein [Nocardioides sp. zg-1228]|uniref:DUF1707 SHOCT-like domain-containing protein n=1 Tax=Nocardioides sp. zg-1228 TaxID=2763008 RepID=UPI0016428433|nr:DUF1707 domain-containing protein [Nocardioides sp. zg-1228]MBC2931619.1 DUF1707 domain-containing protein [Nocardioides sp. zg-1228]QSF57212.1 DUF1707 domain-containing protein [Nocardioides sp. zg-1228]
MSMPPHHTPSAPGDDAYARWRRLQEQADAERDALFVSDAERDQVCRRLSAAFSEGRITAPELDERTSLALAARTYGDLEDVMAGLEAPAMPVPHPLVAAPPARSQSIVPRLLFWVVGLFTAPFILGGSGLLLFGDGPGSWIAGIVMLVLFLPGLVALYRWAHPRR